MKKAEGGGTEREEGGGGYGKRKGNELGELFGLFARLYSLPASPDGPA